MSEASGRSRPRYHLAPVLALAVALAACGGQTPGPANSSAGRVAPAGTAAGEPRVDLRQGGLAVLTPTAAFGQEESRQLVAQAFHKALSEQRPEVPVVPMSKALSAINTAGLADGYGRLHTTYRDTGLLDRDLLRAVGQATGTRYLIQLKLQAFSQGSQQRFALMGLNLLQAQSANLRLFVQIWDATTGEVVWEDSAEENRERPALRNRVIQMDDVLADAVKGMVARLPG